MNEELKPCPFCGGSAMITTWDNGLKDVHCNRCGASTITYREASLAIKAWNRRVQP